MQNLFAALVFLAANQVVIAGFSTQAMAAPLIVTEGDFDSLTIEINASVDGELRRFKFDTGANYSMLTADAKTNLYPSVGRAQLTGASGHSFECDVIKPDVITFDRVALKSQSVRRCSENGIKDNFGLDWLENRVFELDFRSNEIKFPDVVSERWHPWSFEKTASGHILMNVALGDVSDPSEVFSTKAVFDTGAQLTSVDEAFALSRPDIFVFIREIETGVDVSGRPVKMKIFILKSIKIGSYTFENVTVLAFDFSPLSGHLDSTKTIILGGNVITKADWLFDFKKDQWSVEGH